MDINNYFLLYLYKMFDQLPDALVPPPAYLPDTNNGKVRSNFNYANCVRTLGSDVNTTFLSFPPPLLWYGGT